MRSCGNCSLPRSGTSVNNNIFPCNLRKDRLDLEWLWRMSRPGREQIVEVAQVISPYWLKCRMRGLAKNGWYVLLLSAMPLLMYGSLRSMRASRRHFEGGERTKS